MQATAESVTGASPNMQREMVLDLSNKLRQVCSWMRNMTLRQFCPPRVCWAVLTLATCVLPAWTQSQSDFAALKAKAEAGDSRAQVQLGVSYANAQGLPADDPQAVEWFRKAAVQGDANGEYSLGEMYGLGRGVSQDYKQAAQWMQKAADQGEMRALSNLGAMYLNGLGVKKNEKRAFELTQQAADKGLAAAQFGLGSMYANGRGVKQDLSKAMDWYTKAADQDDTPAMNNLAWLFMNTQDSNIRNTPKALDLALRAVNMSGEKEPEYLDTLASAYFDNGHFDKALEAEKKALALRPKDQTYEGAVKNYQEMIEASRNLLIPPPDEQAARVSRDVTAPKPTYTPDPAGPEILHSSGTVVLWAIVGADGKVRDVRVARSSDPDLDERAIQAIRKWNFHPARKKNGQPVAVQINVEVTFKTH
jgi:TonB family protein